MKNLFDRLILALFTALMYPAFSLRNYLERREALRARADLFRAMEKLQASQQARAEDLRKAMARRRADADPAIRAARVLEFREARRAKV